MAAADSLPPASRVTEPDARLKQATGCPITFFSTRNTSTRRKA